MIRWLQNAVEEQRNDLYLLLRRYETLRKPLLLKSELWDIFQELTGEGPNGLGSTSDLGRFIAASQEALVDAPFVCFAVRPRVADWHYVRIHSQALEAELISPAAYLRAKEHALCGDGKSDNWLLDIDLEPFNRDFPRMKERRSIGRGMEFLNRHLSSKLFVDIGKGDRHLLEFLQVHQYRGRQLMVNRRIESVSDLREAIRGAVEWLSTVAPDTPWSDLSVSLQDLGFEPGWGDTARRVIENLSLLSDILEAPEPGNLERFLGRIPMIFSILILSPHGFFGQSNVLGLPDTGGQVVYILDQVRALEKEMRTRLAEQGLDITPEIVIVTRLIPESEGTTCNERHEAIIGTENVQILRVPFRDAEGRIMPHWISRFKLWPYLERFAEEVEVEALARLGSRPDLIVGNYSDGNLVASLLANRLGVTQCNIAHALEKTKYLLSDLYWKEHEAEYHFACQFTADLIAMNTADFIITSTYQEIAGTDSSVGQYESYSCYTLPELYRVRHGINSFDPRFNIVSPGADPDVYFPYSESQRRLVGLHEELEELIWGSATRTSRGCLENRDKPLVFSLARLDRIKNIAGLVAWYAGCRRLRSQANLLVVAGHVNPEDSTDSEEREEIHRMHRLMDEHALDGEVRWIGAHLDKNVSGEVYRWIADRGGVFVQPALFEAFGLTVIEAMISGLPTFATRYGGPLEIIQDGVSGFHLDPNHGDKAAERIASFLEECARDEKRWEQISHGGIARVRERYTWERYAERMMTLARVYGFWRYVSDLERQETQRYLAMLYALQFRPLARAIPH